MQSEIHFANGEKVRVDMTPVETQQALSKQKADASGLIQVSSVGLDQPVMVNPAMVTHVTPPRPVARRRCQAAGWGRSAPNSQQRTAGGGAAVEAGALDRRGTVVVHGSWFSCAGPGALARRRAAFVVDL